MSALDQLLILCALTALFGFLFGNLRSANAVMTVLYGLQGLMLFTMSELGDAGGLTVSAAAIEVLGLPMHWRFDALSWYFALITIGAAFLSSWFSCGAWAAEYRKTGASLRMFNGALALNVLCMLILLAGGNLLSLFIGWELVSWASFPLMALGSAAARRYAMRYLTYAVSGAMAVLGGMVLIYAKVGSFEFEAVRDALRGFGTAEIWVLLFLFSAGFGVKMALLPLHLWQAKAYAESPGPAAAFLGAISSRMGLFAIVVVVIQVIGINRLVQLPVPFTFLNAADLLAWIAVFTIIFPTFTALRQHDARRLLAWHGIGQGGYMLLGLLMADDLGSAGGLMHVFNHASYQALLFMTVTAVVLRTGTADLNRLGGLVARMPLSFFAMLIGIIGLAGLPPMNGFVSKWLVYRSLIIDGSPMLFVGAVIGTLGTILSVYKLLHNTFLGQLRLEHMEVEEAPWSMIAPMAILSVIVFLTGYFPGLILNWTAAAQQAVGLPVLAHHLGGVPSAKGGLDMIWVVSVLLVSFGIGALIFMSGGKSKRVHQLDNYAGGHFLTADTRYQYSDNFYPGLMHLIGPWYRKSFRWAERGVVSSLDAAAMSVHMGYRYAHPALFLLAAVVTALIWVLFG